MIVTDLDGTLLRSDKTISDYTKNVLQACRAAGFKVVYATARGNSAKTLAPCECFDGFVRMNGALGYAGDALIYSKLIPAKTVRTLLLAVDQAGMGIVAERGGVHYANFDVTEHWPWIPHCELADFSRLNIEAEKIYAIASPQVLDLINANLTDELWLSVSRDGLIMVMHKDATKPNAIAALAAHWGIAPAEIAAFGDDHNDIEMLTYAGTGVAMANAIDQAKAAADDICGSNDEDGVARWLDDKILCTGVNL
jgi:hypothetical protein